MSKRARIIIVSVFFGAVGLAVAIGFFMRASHSGNVTVSEFARNVDTSALDGVAVLVDGRLKSFESHAHTVMQTITGGRKIDGQSDAFTYLDMMFNPAKYHEKPVIYVKNRKLREEIAKVLADNPAPPNTRHIDTLDKTPAGSDIANADRQGDRPSAAPSMDDRIKTLKKTGMISAGLLERNDVQKRLNVLSEDVIRFRKHVMRVLRAHTAAEPDYLAGSLHVIPPKQGDDKTPWISIDAIQTGAASLNDPARIDPTTRATLSNLLSRIKSAWLVDDAERSGSELAVFAAVLPDINPALYPDRSRLSWESWYFKKKNMSLIWLVYMFSILFLVIALVYQWRWARYAGLSIFIAAFSLNTFQLILRIYISRRWPNSNMYEAVTTAAWFGAALAVIMEFVVIRRNDMRNLFALGAGAAAMTAQMAAYFLPTYLNPGISNRMPILHDVWLHIHTNVIIFSYCLIFMAAISAFVYLLYRLAGGDSGYATTRDAANLILSRSDDAAGDYTLRDGNDRHPVTFGKILDGATLVTLELGMVMLWMGIIMGAIWADHSWGRPWGWDPKEVFALNTLFIYLILIHVRLKVRDKGLWTGVLAVVGCAVMLFNWIVINFWISGLHSYA